MNTHQDTLQSVQTRLEQIQTSRAIGICFLDSEGRLIQLLDEDPALKDAIVDYHQDRIRQMIRSERAGQAVDRMLGYPVQDHPDQDHPVGNHPVRDYPVLED